jgi:hypothetical protein
VHPPCDSYVEKTSYLQGQQARSMVFVSEVG